MNPTIVVVGAGIVGCTIAYDLAKSGAAVRVLEPRAPGQGATRASAGILAPDIEGHGSTLLRLLGRRSIDLYDDFIAGLRADSGHEIFYQRNGTFDLAFSDGDVDRLGELAKALERDGIEARWVLPSSFDHYEPLASKQARGALFIPAHGFVGVTSLTLAAAAAAQKCGAVFHSDVGAVRIFATPDGRVGVQASSDRWDADRVVLAAGSWSSMITVDRADQIPVKPIRGQLIQLQTDRGLIHRVIWGADGYLVPWPDGSVLIGSTVEDVGFDEHHTDDAIVKLRTVAARLVPTLANAQMSSVRTGLRPKGPDDLPIIGRSKAVPGLIYATAHYRNGVMFAPLTVRLVTDLVFDRAADPALRDLDPARVGTL
ncbi:MAG TPA: glycine oxidase ThiO [Vicinamibacterales bacterium]|nr:glycine oxidase ThiO [Vicinamibacterales bacterium]